MYQARSKGYVSMYLSLVIRVLTVRQCHIEYLKIIRAVGIGFIMMGVVGYAIKLVCFCPFCFGIVSYCILTFKPFSIDPYSNPLLDCLIVFRYICFICPFLCLSFPHKSPLMCNNCHLSLTSLPTQHRLFMLTWRDAHTP